MRSEQSPTQDSPQDPHRMHIDWTRCDGHGACAELLPELLDQDEWGYPVSRSGDRDPAIPRDLDALALRAVRNCPLQALRSVPSGGSLRAEWGLAQPRRASSTRKPFALASLAVG